MSQGDLVQRMEQLLADRVPFVTATVVRAAKPTSVRPGDAAIVNAICDALGVRHVDMPCTPSRVWDAMRSRGRPAQ